jgi:trk system potassium uptake protein TrkH
MGDFFNHKIVFSVLGRSMVIIAIAFIACMVVASLFGEPLQPFFISFLVSLFLGGVLIVAAGKQDAEDTVQKKDAYLTVTLTWVLMGLVGSIPYLISGSIPSFVDAFFESISGFSTTGASILTDVEVLPKSMLFWRSLTHWIGGIGIIVLVIIVMPSLRMGSYHLFTLESSLQDKIQPRIISVGKRIVLIYIVLTFTEIVLLMLGDMNLFESVCHAFGTVATGGFSPKNNSIAGYSPYIQYVIAIFMLLAGTNFVVHYYLFKREFKRVKQNEELWFYLTVVFSITIVVAASLYFKVGEPLEKSFRDAFFQVVSIITCTGFASADYLQWPVFASGVIFFCMFLGGSTGSTSGGIKMARHLVLLKNIQRIVRHSTSRNAIIPLRINGHTISDESNSSILTFISVYFMLFLIATTLLVFMGIDGQTSGSAVATCMAGIGPGIGTVGPVSNFAHLPSMGKWLLSFMMLVGRLEIFTVILLFSRRFWLK